MPRQRKTAAEQVVLQSAAQLSLQVAKKTSKKGARISAPRARLTRLVELVEKMAEDDEWHEKDQNAATLVALFCWAHEAIYGVSCTAEVARVFNGATSSADKLLREEFHGKFDDALDYMRWVWNRERKREQWRRANTGYGKVLTWRNVFRDGYLVKEMRLEELRTKGVD